MRWRCVRGIISVGAINNNDRDRALFPVQKELIFIGLLWAVNCRWCVITFSENSVADVRLFCLFHFSFVCVWVFVSFSVNHEFEWSCWWLAYTYLVFEINNRSFVAYVIRFDFSIFFSLSLARARFFPVIFKVGVRSFSTKLCDERNRANTIQTHQYFLSRALT